MSTQLTNQIYRDYLNPKVQALFDVPPTPDGRFDIMTRESLARTLSEEGFIIDRAIMIEGWDAARTMEIRESYGYKEFPNAFTATPTIKVSTDAKDYPAFTPPPPPFVPNSSPVGAESSGQFSVNLSVCWVNGKFMYTDGDLFTDSTGTYLFHQFPGMFGPVRFWTKK